MLPMQAIAEKEEVEEFMRSGKDLFGCQVMAVNVAIGLVILFGDVTICDNLGIP